MAEEYQGRTFDWVPPPTDRAEAHRPYLVSAQAASIRTDRPLRSYSWRRTTWLDQGSEGACTGFGAGHALAYGPRPRTITDADARGFYRGAQRYDAWEGENYEGSSVEGVMRYLHHETKHLNSYWWATTLNEVLHAIAYYGPVEMGSVWRTQMMGVHDDGYVRNKGSVVGGHAYVLASVDLRRERSRLDNSWGRRGWGIDGSAWISFEDIDALLNEQGECAVPRKRLVA